MPFVHAIKRSLIRSPLHRVSLEAEAFYQKLAYASAGMGAPESRHQPKVLCIGNFKTGTVSLAGLLGQKLTGAHEPDAYLYAKTWLRKERGILSQTGWERFLLRRNNHLRLDFEASGFLTEEAETLVRLFPEAKFIVTIREPESWLYSLEAHIEKNRRILGCHYWEPVFRRWFGSKASEAPHETRKNPSQTSSSGPTGYSRQKMLDYWLRSNRTAIRAIPRHRRLILPTKKLSEEIDRIEQFLGWKTNALDRTRSHLHHSRRKETTYHTQMAKTELIPFQHTYRELIAT